MIRPPYKTAPSALYYADRQGETVEPFSVYHKLEISWASDSSRGAVSYTYCGGVRPMGFVSGPTAYSFNPTTFELTWEK